MGRADTARRERPPRRRGFRPLLAAAAFVLLALAGLAAERPASAQIVVEGDWALNPSDLGPEDRFRLIFVSSQERTATSTDIADYNTWVQGLAAAGHGDIQAWSDDFRVVGCTGAVDAVDNASTDWTPSDRGVPIYWLNGAKVADDYEDFHDGDWVDEANAKDESGTDWVSNQSLFTGCDHDGTESFSAGR